MSAYKVAFALLVQPELAGGTLRQLAAASGVGLGTATRAMRLLGSRGWVFGEPGRREVDAVELWRAFERGYVDRLAGKLEHGRYRPLTGLEDWLEGLMPELGPDIHLGGAAAAEELGLDIVAATGALHVADWDASVLARVRLVPDPNGPVVVRSQFGTAAGSGPLAHPILIRAELLLDPDERLDGSRATLAEQIRAEWSS